MLKESWEVENNNDENKKENFEREVFKHANQHD